MPAGAVHLRDAECALEIRHPVVEPEEAVLGRAETRRCRYGAPGPFATRRGRAAPAPAVARSVARRRQHPAFAGRDRLARVEAEARRSRRTCPRAGRRAEPPKPQAASSTTQSECFAGEGSSTASIGGAQAEQCTGMMPTVRGVTSDSSCATSRLKVARSMSQNTGVAPMYSTTFAVATQVKAGTMTSSPGSRPSARPRCAAPSCTTCRDRVRCADVRGEERSNSPTCGPLHDPAGLERLHSAQLFLAEDGLRDRDRSSAHCRCGARCSASPRATPPTELVSTPLDGEPLVERIRAVKPRSRLRLPRCCRSGASRTSAPAEVLGLSRDPVISSISATSSLIVVSTPVPTL